MSFRTNGTAQADLTNELVSKGAKITLPHMAAATRMPNGNIASLGRGNSQSGLRHIVERHGAEFARIGIPEGKIPDFLMQAPETENPSVSRAEGVGGPSTK